LWVTRLILEKVISVTEALTSCSLDEAARLSYAMDLRHEIQKRENKKGGE
jgi:hypothetical protein